MKTLSISPCLVLATLLLAQAQSPTNPASTKQEATLDALASEPPLRARVTLGDEVFEVDLGGSATLSDGRTLALELLASRRFAVPAAFSFDYPRDWRFTGALGVPAPVDAWWSLSGDGAAVYLRRHAGDAQVVREQYLAGLESLQNGIREGATLDLDGRTLEGGVVTYESPGIGAGYQSSTWEQRVFAWQENEGVAWLLTFHAQLPTPAGYDLLGYLPAFDLVFELTDAGDAVDVLAPVAPAAPVLTELEALFASFRWL